jgi:hypothetical protein
MGMERTEEIIKRVGYRLIREYGEDYVELLEIHYPLEHQGFYNNVKISITLYDDGRLVCSETRHNWNGTGVSRLCDVKLSIEDAKKMKELMLSARSEEDFKKLLDYARELNYKYTEQLERLIDELVDELMNLDDVQRAIESIQDSETRARLVERLKEVIRDEIESYLFDAE